MILTPKQVANDSEIFARTFLRILDKNERLIPFTWNPVQGRLHQSKTGRDLILKSRQVGISTYEQGDIFHDLVTKTTRAITLCHDDTTTQILRQTVDRFYEHCSFNGIRPARKYANSTMATYSDYDSMHVIGTAGNTEIGRGGSYSRIHGSEVAQWKDAKKILSGAMQGGRPAVVLESTPNGAQGAFYEYCMEALRGDGVWKLHFIAWWDALEYRLPLDAGEVIEYNDEEKKLVTARSLKPEQIKWRRYKIKELRDKFAQEYPEDPITCFLTSGNSYFGDLSDVFAAPADAVYNAEHEYVGGLDFGQTNDFTAMPIIDATAKVQVDLLHMKNLAWAEQRARIVEKYKQWHCVRVGAEMNSIGSVNVEALQSEGLTIMPFTTTNSSKAEICSDLYEALHTDGLKLIDHPVQRHELSTFVSTQTATGIWRLAAEGDGHDDTVIGLAIGWWTITHKPWLMF